MFQNKYNQFYFKSNENSIHSQTPLHNIKITTNILIFIFSLVSMETDSLKKHY